jgi:hypothetical protein
MLPFLRVCAAGGNDPDNLVDAFGPIRMHDGNYPSSIENPDRVPTLLAIFHPFHERQAVRIVEHELGGFKPDTMLSPIYFVLVLVPFEPEHLLLAYRVNWRTAPGAAVF